MRPTAARLLICLGLGAALAPQAAAQSSVPSLAELELGLRGTTVRLEEAVPAVPKGVAAALRVVASAGAGELTVEELRRFLGTADQPADFQVQAELSGPGLSGTLTLPEAGGPANVNVLALPLPALVPAGDYRLSNLRVVVGGQAVLDVEPRETTLRVVDQVMVTRVTTRPLTLDEIRERGIVLDSEAYLGFEFAVVLRLDSQDVPFSFPVVFQREGVALPLDIVPPGPPLREGVNMPPTLFRPVLLQFHRDRELDSGPTPELDLGDGEPPVTVPGLLVIPGEVGYLKQFFSARLYVANGAPEGSHLSLEEIRATIKLPPGLDGVPGTSDDPLSLPEILRDGQPTPQSVEMPVRLIDDEGQPGEGERLMPRQQGLAEYVVRGEREGFHRLDFDLQAKLLGVPGPGGEPRDIPVTGKASGGVLVRNPYFHVSFAVPNVVRDQEPFKVFVTVTNVGQATANQFHLSLDTPSGLVLASEPGNPARRDVDELRAGDSRTFEYRCVSQRTGQVIAKYLALLGTNSSGSYGTLNFTLGIDERGVPLSPDTLVLPDSVDELPLDVVQAAMRVLGQAWSAAKAPLGSLPAGVKRVPQQIVVMKGLALAEAGLRVRLRGGDPSVAQRDALRELFADFVRPERLAPGVPEDASFDQLLRQTDAGRELLARVGAHLGPAAAAAGGPSAYEQAFSEVLASGEDFVAFAADLGSPRAADLALFDGTGLSARIDAAEWAPVFGLPSAAALPLGDATAPLLGLVSRPRGAYLLELTGRHSGQGDLSISLPAGDGTFRRVALAGLALQPGSRTWIAIDPASPGRVLLSEDIDGNGVADGPPVERFTTSFEGQGPNLLAAAVVGPETFASASEFGLHAALLFDREVEAESASKLDNYALPGQALSPNHVVGARRQLSGRLVFALLGAPEGPYRPQSLSVSGIEDRHGHAGPSTTVPLQVRLTAPGGVVTGRVLKPGTAGPVPGGTVYYLNTPDGASGCSTPGDGEGLAAVSFGTDGRYELRYVKQGLTACPFYVLARDPVTGARRYGMGRIPGPGAEVTLDVVMPGVGSVRGVVRNRYSLAPVPGAAVVATSNTDPQSGGKAYADAEGRFEIGGLTVGPITLRAARGIGAGIASTRIMHAGHTAVRDVELDEGALSVGGTVRKYESGQLAPVAGALVVIYFDGVPVGWRHTDSSGGYRFPGMPAGSFYVTAEWVLTQQGGAWVRLEDRRTGQAYAGHDITDHDLVLQVPPAVERRDVVGHVLMADGVTPVAEAVVSIGGLAVTAVLSGLDGGFTLPDVPVQPNPQQFTISARGPDGRRTGSASVQLATSGQVPSDVRVRLSGVGSVVLSVLGPDGFAVPAGIEVGRLGGCANACGCSKRVTNGGETVTFEDLGAGQTHQFQAVWVTGAGYTDFASASVTVPGDGQAGFGILRFGGVGRVRVTVKDGDGQLLGASPVTLRAPKFVHDAAGTCGLEEVARPPQSTGPNGEVTFEKVLVNGAHFRATAVHPTAPDLWATTGGSVNHAGATNLAEIRLRVQPMAGQLSGRVFMPNGDLAGDGVRVTIAGPIGDYTVETNANGEYGFVPILPAGGYTITAVDPDPDHGGALLQERLHLPPGDGRVFDLRLKGRGTVRVQVEDAQGPLERALVKLQETGYPNGLHTRSLEQPDGGVAVFDQVYQGPFSVSVQEPNGRGGRLDGVLPAAGETVEFTLRVTPTGCVRGTFLMPDGQAVPNGVVQLRAGPYLGVLGQVTTESGASAGTFAFDFVPLGQVRLQASDPYTARNGEAAGRLEVEGRLSDPNASCLTLEVRAEGLGTVRGPVTSNETPQPGIEVEVASGRYRSRTVSNGEGSYEIDGVPVGQVTARALPPGGHLAGSATASLVADGQTLELPVPLRDSVSIEGLLLASDGASAGAVSEIFVYGPTVPGWNPLKAYSGADGQFRLDHVPVGLMTFDARALQSADRGRKAQELQRDGPAPVPVSLQLRGVGRLRGHLRDGAGNPLPVQSRVIIQTSGDYYAYSERVVNVAEGGELEYPELLAGTYSVHLRADLGSGARSGSASVEVAPVTPQDPGAWTEVTVLLEPTGTVTGRVFRPASPTTPGVPGPPAFGAEVRLTVRRPDGSLVYVSGITRQGGTFEVPGIAVGEVWGYVRDNVTGGLAALPAHALQSDETFPYGDLDMTTDALQVVSVSPPDGSENVALDTPIRVGFNLPLASASHIAPLGGGYFLPTLEGDGRTVVLTPQYGAWPHTTQITVDVTRWVADVFGRRLPVPVQSRFRTVDLVPPKVSESSPAHNATQVPPGTPIRAVFDEPLLPGQDFAGVIVARADSHVGAVIAGVVQFESPSTVTFTPLQPWSTDATYYFSVQGALDASGNAQTQVVTAMFKTPDTQQPVGTVIQPAQNAWTKVGTLVLHVSFWDGNSGMDPSTGRLWVDGTPVTVPQNAGLLIYTPPAAWAEGWHHFQAWMKDVAGNEGTVSGDFGVDLTPPSTPELNVADDQTVSGNVGITLATADAVSGIDTTYLTIDGHMSWPDATPPYAFTITPGTLGDGLHQFIAGVIDRAGNSSTRPFSLYFDNTPLTVTIQAPAANVVVRDSVTVSATVNEAVDRVEFAADGVPAVNDASAPYQQTLQLGTAPEGLVSLVVTAVPPRGLPVTATRTIRVDRTPPPAPDIARITAAPPAAGLSLVTGYGNAVEGSVRVELRNLTAGGTLLAVTAAANGSFGASLAGSVDDQVEIVAVDPAGNRSQPSLVSVRATPPLPPGAGLSLTYDGLLIDGVGPGAAALAGDGAMDAVFRFSLSIGQGLTRQIKHVDLVGPLSRSTRAVVGSILGVSTSVGDPFLNQPATGEISFPVEGGATLTLVASDVGGFIQPGFTYTATAEFTDGSRFVASTTLALPENQPQVVHSLDLAVTPGTVLGSVAAPGTAVITLANLRDVDGGLVPDGSRVALSVADLAANDPRGNPIRSAGGQIEGGTQSANNVNFRVFEVLGGQVSATYSSSPVDPAAVLGAQVVVQVLPADAQGQVLGHAAIATFDLNLRRPSDRAVVTLSPPAIYADKGDRRAALHIELRDAAGNLETGTRYVLVSAAAYASSVGSAPVVSTGGGILGGSAAAAGSSYRLFSTTNGVVECEYSSLNLWSDVGQLKTAQIQVLDADAAGNRLSTQARGVGTLVLAGPGSAELSVTPGSLPLVWPPRLAQVRVRSVRDTRAQPLPEGAFVLLTATQYGSTWGGVGVVSPGGRILEGQPSPSPAGYGLQAFPISGPQLLATYEEPLLFLAPGATDTANIQVVAASPDMARLAPEALAVKPVRLLAPLNAVGDADPPSLLADAKSHTSVITFDPVLDAWGNPLPDGSYVAVTAATAVANHQGASVQSAGGQILNGTPVGQTVWNTFAVQGGGVTVQYANQGLLVAPGQTSVARISMVSANQSGAPVSGYALGVVPVALAGLTSGTLSASPASLVADGGDRRTTITLTNLRDALGNPAPEGTLVALAAFSYATSVNGVGVVSAGGSIIGGMPPAQYTDQRYRVFSVTNGQVVAEYSSAGVNVATGTKTAVVQVALFKPDLTLGSSVAVATLPVTLTAPGAATVTADPPARHADGSDGLVQVTVASILDSAGNPVPDGTKVLLTSVHNAAQYQNGTWIPSVPVPGGDVRTAGTSPGDGANSNTSANYKVFTVAGGQVQAVFSSINVKPGVNQTLTARVSLLPANYNATSGQVTVSTYKAVGTGEIQLRGTSSTSADGPAALSRGGGGQSAPVTFTGIKDAAGNTVPDGTKVIATTGNNLTQDPVTNASNASVGGTITDGAVSSSGSSYKVFTVSGGAVTVTYSTVGSSAAGLARVQLMPADSAGAKIGTKSLVGGVWAIQVNP